tara:strand:- start:66 stop:767 length:702 start_codon:yes stop_codon:yes gene_type:complete
MNQAKKVSNQGLPLISLRNACFSWPNGKRVLDKCSFSISNAGLWMIVGINGSGKSTLFKLLNGMLKLESGFFSCKLKPSLMFQNPDHQLLMPSCRSDLMLNLPRSLNNYERHRSIQKALYQVRMQDMESRPIHTLSGGQKQRLALAGALTSGANLLLLDEPTALLDPSCQQSVLEIVQQLTRKPSNPITALWITHRLEELQYSDGAAIMDSGRVGPFLSGKELFDQLKPLAGR